MDMYRPCRTACTGYSTHDRPCRAVPRVRRPHAYDCYGRALSPLRVRSPLRCPTRRVIVTYDTEAPRKPHAPIGDGPIPCAAYVAGLAACEKTNAASPASCIRRVSRARTQINRTAHPIIASCPRRRIQPVRRSTARSSWSCRQPAKRTSGRARRAACMQSRSPPVSSPDAYHGKGGRAAPSWRIPSSTPPL